MAKSLVGILLKGVGSVLRWLIYPIILLTAALVRYNAFSLVYLVLFLFMGLIPGPKTKQKTVGGVLYLVLVFMLSSLFFLAQAFFQISLETGPKLDHCSTQIANFHQIGLIQFSTSTFSASYFIMHISVDLVVSIVSLISLIIAIKSSPPRTAAEQQSTHGIQPALNSLASPEQHHTSETSSKQQRLLESSTPSLSSSSLVYSDHHSWSGPSSLDWLLILLDIAIFFLFCLSGVLVPSIVSFWYFAVFLLLCTVWSSHWSKAHVVRRALKLISLIYSAVHIIALYVYQFRTVQISTDRSGNSVSTTIIRLAGLTPIVKQTDCAGGDILKLSLVEDIPASFIVYPFSILLLYWMLAIECGAWFRSSSHRPSSTIADDSISLPLLSAKNNTKYGTMQVRQQQKDGGIEPDSSHLSEESNEDMSSSSPVSHSMGLTAAGSYNAANDETTAAGFKEYLLQYYSSIVNLVIYLCELVISFSYVSTITAMMVWSVLYPSPPALVLLLWAVAIWVIPRINPKQSLQYSSPLLVIYAIVLLVLSYINALPVKQNDFLLSYQDIGEINECNGSLSSSFGIQNDCVSLALGIKNLLSLTFFASLWQSLKTKRHSSSTALGTKFSESSPVLFSFMSMYWIMVVVSAFALVIFTGQPSVLKSVYIIFLFIFLLTYQLFGKKWIKICKPLWLLALVYAAVHLVTVYTYQFDFVRKYWWEAFDSLSISNATSPEDVFQSLGTDLRNDSGFKELFNPLVPPAVFIAVVALQYRYFSPKDSITDMTQEGHEQITKASKAVLKIFKQMINADNEETTSETNSEALEQPATPHVKLRSKRIRRGNATRRSFLYDSSAGLKIHVLPLADAHGDTLDEETPQKGETELIFKEEDITTGNRLYSMLKKATTFLKEISVKLIVSFWKLFWRFFQIHTAKFVVILVFGFGLYEPSSSYLLIIFIMIGAVPLQFISPVLYPLLTLYLGTIVLIKYIFQVPAIPALTFKQDECNVSNISSAPIEGVVFNYTFFPQNNDSDWLGLSKTSNTSDYIGFLVAIALLICFCYTTKRHQKKVDGITVRPWKVTALFHDIEYAEINNSFIHTVKFLISHIFDLFGTEICFILEAVLIATHIDVYGIVYALLLGLMLLLPRKVYSTVLWPLLVVVHGALLGAQYVMLVGFPPSYLCSKNGYPWESLTSSNRTSSTISRWLYLPQTGGDTLNRSLLYADVIVYMAICYQAKRSMVSDPAREIIATIPVTLGDKQWFKFLKEQILKNFFWLTAFALFVAAALRLSVFGLVYLIVCLWVVYQGPLQLRQSEQRWSSLRVFVWIMLVLRSVLQLLSCTLLISGSNSAVCVLVSLFDIRCIKGSYYGIKDDQECVNGTGDSGTGLWLDFMAFLFVTIQIVIVNSQYYESIREIERRNHENAQRFAEKRNMFLENRTKDIELREKEDRENLKQREIALKETMGVVDLMLYAGVHVPSQYQGPAHSDKGEYESVTMPLDDTHGDRGGEGEPESGKGMNKVQISYHEDKRPAKDRGGFRLRFRGKNKRDTPTSDETRPLAEVHDEEKVRDKPHSDNKKSSLLIIAKYLKAVFVEMVMNIIKRLEVPSADYKYAVLNCDSVQGSNTSDEGATNLDSINEESTPLLVHPLSSPSKGLENSAEIAKPTLSLHTLFRFFSALYYWSLSHFGYLVFLLVIIAAIVSGGTLPSLVYVSLLFLWGGLSSPHPSRLFWQTMLYSTITVMLLQFMYTFTIRVLLMFVSDGLNEPALGDGITRITVFGWLLGNETNKDYFRLSLASFVLLCFLAAHRNFLKQQGRWLESPETISFRETFNKFIIHVKQWIKSSSPTGDRRDYYVVSLICDILCFLTIIFGYSDFAVTTNINNGFSFDFFQVADFIRSNNVPLPFIMILFFQFLSILIDRAIYIRQSRNFKLIFHIFLFIAWNISLLLIIPITTQRSFIDNHTAQTLYFFKSVYFVFSGCQISSGYPIQRLRYFLGSSYSVLNEIYFRCYRTIPLVSELREVVDWMFTDTVMSLKQWLRVQEIWATVYLVKVRRMREKNYDPRNLGGKTNNIIKYLQGSGSLIALLLLIWGPPILISLVNQTGIPNPPVFASVSLTLEGSKLLEIEAQDTFIHRLTSDQYTQLKKNVNSQSVKQQINFNVLFVREDFSYVRFPGNSSIIWSASPTSKEQLKSVLALKNETSMTFSWTLRRSESIVSDELATGSYQKQLSSETITQFIDSLENSNTTRSIFLQDLYPIIVYASNNGKSEEFTLLSKYISPNKFSCNASLSTEVAYTLPHPNSTDNNTLSLGTIINQWWTLKPATNSTILLTSDDLTEDGGLEMLVYSERVSPSIFGYAASIGVVGLYLSVVLVISKFIRGYINSLPHSILIDQMVDPDRLLELLNDIYAVRESGDLIMEEILVGKLYSIMRSSDKFISLTDGN